MDRIIYQSIILNCPFTIAFKFFTSNNNLEKWLTKVADVEPWVGGRYELFWRPEDRENDSTIGCKILAISSNKFLCFEWKGPQQFKKFMNNIRPLTCIAVSFIPHPEGTEIHLLHTGWRNTADWEEARQWFDKAWTNALSQLKNYIKENKYNA